MLNKKHTFIILIILFFFSACQDVVEINLKEGEKQLVVEANIDWQVNTPGREQSITLSTTMPFFEEGVPPKVSGAKIFVQDDLGNRFPFIESASEKGTYKNQMFLPKMGMNYTLHIAYNGQKYKAVDTMRPAPPSLEIVQKNNGGILGNQVEIRGYLENARGLYLVRIESEHYKKPFYITLDNNSFNTDSIFFIYASKDFKPKDRIKIRVYSISRFYYNYMTQLLQITQGDNRKGPFTAPPSDVKGNVVNEQDSNKNLLGAFRVSQYIEKEYIIK